MTACMHKHIYVRLTSFDLMTLNCLIAIVGVTLLADMTWTSN